VNIRAERNSTEWCSREMINAQSMEITNSTEMVNSWEMNSTRDGEDGEAGR
jgi:hypothetical protein